MTQPDYAAGIRVEMVGERLVPVISQLIPVVLNRLVKKDYPTGTDTTFAYDALGRRTQMVDSTGTTSYTYDLLGRLLTCTQPCGAVSKTVSYSYDAAGNRATMTDPDGGVQTYTNDNNNRLASTTSPYAGTTPYVYDAIGRVTRQNNGNGTYVLNTFDIAGNLTLLENRKSDNSLLSSFAYTVDNVGNRLAITESVLGTDNTTYHNATVSYGYDLLYRLTSEHRIPANPGANNPAFWYEYSYDAAGNRLLLTQKDEAGNVIGTTASTYDAANKLLTAGNTAYTWDANGNQTGKTVNNATTTYVWDFEDKMTQLHDGVTMTFTTDADGFRRSLTKDGATTHFLYDRRTGTAGLDPLVVEVDASGPTSARYVHAVVLVTQARGGTMGWYHYEVIGTTRQLTNSQGAVSDFYGYDAWGNQLTTQGATTNPFGYVGNHGYYNDAQSGLMLVGARYYQAPVGRFVSVGPKKWHANWYSYTDGNPCARVDPSGLAFGIPKYWRYIPCILCMGSAAAGLGYSCSHCWRAPDKIDCFADCLLTIIAECKKSRACCLVALGCSVACGQAFSEILPKRKKDCDCDEEKWRKQRMVCTHERDLDVRYITGGWVCGYRCPDGSIRRGPWVRYRVCPPTLTF